MWPLKKVFTKSSGNSVRLKKEKSSAKALRFSKKKVLVDQRRSFPEDSGKKSALNSKASRKGRAVKTRTSLPKISTERVLLRGALQDLNKEMLRLGGQKRSLEYAMHKVSKELTSTQNTELRLRAKASQLLRIEATLGKEKAATKDKLLALDKRIEKVKSIRRELKDV